MVQTNQSRILAQYNFNPSDIDDGDFDALYTHRRRDSFFAFAYARGERYYALRDHLGGIPLYYRQSQDGVKFSINIGDLVAENDTFNTLGLQAFLKFGTTRLYPLSDSIGIVPPGTVVEFNPAQSRRTVYQYALKPPTLPQSISMRRLIEELDKRLRRAVERVLVHNTVGLYLSGGIDSALIGLYLRELGVKVNAYTSAPWGKISSETPFARANAVAIGAQTHSIVDLESYAYESLFAQLPQIYGGPHGTTTALGVASIWRNTAIGDEQQVFFGQNSDTATCSVPAQYLTYFSSYMPAFLRKRMHPAFRHDEIVDRYLALKGPSLVGADDLPSLAITGGRENPTALQQLTIAGMAIAHTPSDSEVLSQPAISRGQLVSDPYFDVDVVEFLVATPLRHRLAVSRKSRLYLTLEKRVLQQLALRYLPRDLVFRKKGFTVSLERDSQAQRFLASLPQRVQGIEAGNTEARFAAGVLSQWAEQTGLAGLDVS